MKKLFRTILTVFVSIVLLFPFNLYAFSSGDKTFKRYGEREEITLIKTEYRYVTVTPEGQPAGGFKSSSGGSLYVDPTGGSTSTLSISVSWGVVSVGVSLGVADFNTRYAYVLNFPNKVNYYKAKIKKKIKLDYLKIDTYKYDELQYTFYKTESSEYSYDVYLEKVG